MSSYKAGDKVCVLCEVINRSESSVWVEVGSRQGRVWVNASDCRPVEPPVVKDSFTTESNCPEIPDSSSEPMRAAFQDWIAIKYDWDASHFSRNENRYFDSSVEMAWQAFRAGAGYGDPRGQPEPTDREPQCEKDLWRGPVIDPIKVGDAVRFVLPGHERHGTEGIILSIVRGPNHQYRFDSNCSQFHRYCTASELELTTKRYRTPTLSDLANGPIECEYRDSDEENWQSGFLVHILNGDIPFLCVNQEQELSGQWDQCRIELGE